MKSHKWSSLIGIVISTSTLLNDFWVPEIREDVENIPGGVGVEALDLPAKGREVLAPPSSFGIPADGRINPEADSRPGS